MKKKLLFFIAVMFLCSILTFAQKPKLVLIETNVGNIKIKLYDETPRHRDNFLKLVNEKFYDSILFHRVIKEFMIQAGDPNSRKAKAGEMLGARDLNYTIPAEFNAKLFHKKGALAAARQSDDVNPNKESSGSQFYIVQGKMFDELTLNKMEENRNNTRISNYLRDYIYKPENVAIKAKMEEYQKKQNKAGLDSIMNAITIIINEQHKYETKFQYSKEQRVAYKTIGGTPLLDGEYTVFGEVIVGLDIVDKIAAYTVGANDRPKIDIRVIGMKVVKK